MKLEKNDRIISNADYERLVGLAELHERAIKEVVGITINKQVDLVYDRIIEARSSLLGLRRIIDRHHLEMRKLADKLQEKNAEIARLQKKYWWKIF